MREVVPTARLELAQYCYRGILNPLRLPIPPRRHRDLSPFGPLHFWQGTEIKRISRHIQAQNRPEPPWWWVLCKKKLHFASQGVM